MNDTPPTDTGDATRSPRRYLGWIAAGIGLVLVGIAAVLVVVTLSNRPSGVGPTLDPGPSGSSQTSEAPSPSPSESVTGSPAASAAATASATATPIPSFAASTIDLEWTRTGSFPTSGGLSIVLGVAPLGDRYVAVGVEYVEPLPVLGPRPPHETRVWTSTDGRTWAPVTLDPALVDVELTAPVVLADGSLLATGVRVLPTEFRDEEYGAWRTTDGITWTETDIPMDGIVSGIARGARGLLVVVSALTSDDQELWMSADGSTWERVHTVEADYLDIGAGDEGFAAVGWSDEIDGPIAIASGDGRTWVDGTDPGFSPFLEVAAFGSDWIVVDDPGGPMPTWFSANGLGWTPHGGIPGRTIPVDEMECREFRRDLLSSGPWLVASTDLTYPCSEGAYAIHGTQYLSLDGAGWAGLPFTEGTPMENRSGSSVNGVLPVLGGLILVGEENGAATFWFGEAP